MSEDRLKERERTFESAFVFNIWNRGGSCLSCPLNLQQSRNPFQIFAKIIIACFHFAGYLKRQDIMLTGLTETSLYLIIIIRIDTFSWQSWHNTVLLWLGWPPCPQCLLLKCQLPFTPIAPMMFPPMVDPSTPWPTSHAVWESRSIQTKQKRKELKDKAGKLTWLIKLENAVGFILSAAIWRRTF